jgi:hypothetical protein
MDERKKGIGKEGGKTRDERSKGRRGIRRGGRTDES